MTTRRHAATAGWIAVFVGCIVMSNWALLHIGYAGDPGEPRTIPLGFGLHAPSGVLFAGALLTLRDIIHERVGPVGTLTVILAAAPVTALTSSGSLAVASGATFVVAEVADLLVYSRVRRRGRVVAVVCSNVVSSVIDSALFLAIAFGSAAALHGTLAMTTGKLAASLAMLAVIAMVFRAVHSR